MKIKTVYAFTLAEVLIVIGIIGIIATLTIPALIENYQKQTTVIQLKKTYSVLSQAIQRSEVDNGSIIDWNFSQDGKEFFDEYLAKYLIITGETTVGDIEHKYNIVYRQISGAPEAGLLVLHSNASAVILSSGVQIFCDNIPYGPSNINKREYFGIDINGFKKPNVSGKDIFYFYIYQENGLTPFHEDDTENNVPLKRERLINGPSAYNYQCNKSGRGEWCGALIMYDGWKISDDYPWN